MIHRNLPVLGIHLGFNKDFDPMTRGPGTKLMMESWQCLYSKDDIQWLRPGYVSSGRHRRGDSTPKVSQYP